MTANRLTRVPSLSLSLYSASTLQMQLTGGTISPTDFQSPPPEGHGEVGITFTTGQMATMEGHSAKLARDH